MRYADLRIRRSRSTRTPRSTGARAWRSARCRAVRTEQSFDLAKRSQVTLIPGCLKDGWGAEFRPASGHGERARLSEPAPSPSAVQCRALEHGAGATGPERGSALASGLAKHARLNSNQRPRLRRTRQLSVAGPDSAPGAESWPATCWRVLPVVADVGHWSQIGRNGCRELKWTAPWRFRSTSARRTGHARELRYTPGRPGDTSLPTVEHRLPFVDAPTEDKHDAPRIITRRSVRIPPRYRGRLGVGLPVALHTGRIEIPGGHPQGRPSVVLA